MSKSTWCWRVLILKSCRSWVGSLFACRPSPPSLTSRSSSLSKSSTCPRTMRIYSETLTSPARGNSSPRITLSSLSTSLGGGPKTLPFTLYTGIFVLVRILKLKSFYAARRSSLTQRTCRARTPTFQSGNFNPNSLMTTTRIIRATSCYCLLGSRDFLNYFYVKPFWLNSKCFILLFQSSCLGSMFWACHLITQHTNVTSSHYTCEMYWYPWRAIFVLHL